MKLRAHHLLPVAAAGLLVGGVLALRGLETPPASVTAPAPAPAPAAALAPSAAPPPAAAVAAAAPTATAAGAAPAEAEGPATEVPIGPGDEVPTAHPDNAEPALPPPPDELPQTAAWKREKTEHIHGVLQRQVGRLEGELAQARAAGNTAEAERLAVLVTRQKRRLGELAAQTSRLREEEAREGGGDLVSGGGAAAAGTPP
jgi:hypothetical protein